MHKVTKKSMQRNKKGCTINLKCLTAKRSIKQTIKCETLPTPPTKRVNTKNQEKKIRNCKAVTVMQPFNMQ